MPTNVKDRAAVEIMDRAKEIYNRVIRPKFEASNAGRLVAIDVNSEQFEIGDEVMEISRQLLDRNPNAEIATLRIGGGPVYRIGFVPQDGAK